ncbi:MULTISPECIES: hypothetical protein [Pseudobutyrivibrio]|uniref:Uncharacterized protein n=1 Tax=Pseudobutyrivibrio xylanivorans TaxID=185007 RepID=A0A1G5RUS2_PSEXY|nr:MULTISPECIES: hypothetical protein [Pseudobutyrivibrio]MDC7279613.1 hypothetical protein [Butyrivibrio fibrisolvens]SCZ77470.1 hypothetical protein SAMN02910350_00789 [Pseudobutyrivibrio xylanivorans]
MAQNTKKTLPTSVLKSYINKDNLPLIALIWLVVFSVVAIIVSCVAFDINVVVACVMVVLEAALAACLNRIPIWIHGLVFIAQIVIGILASQVAFMVLMAFIYVFAIAFLFIWASR